MENFIVTTARKPKGDSEILALQFAQNLNLKFVLREDFSLETKKKFTTSKIFYGKVAAPCQFYFGGFMENFIVTTARKPKGDSEILALQFAQNLNLKFVPLRDFSLKKIYNVENILW